MDETSTLGIIAFALQFTILLSYVGILNCKVRSVEQRLHKKTCRCCGADMNDPLNP